MRRLERRHKVYQFGARTPPAMEVWPGETIVVETTDSADAQIDLSGSGVLGKAYIDPKRAMPMTGPIYVRGTMPGDVLEVQVLGVVATGNGFVLPGCDRLLEQGVPLPEGGGCVVALRRGAIQLTEGLQVPYGMMIGALGVAPDGEPIDALDPGDFGGNHDCRFLREGARLFLPVQVPGALVSLGDVHAAMGDGELAGSAVECGGEVTLRLHIRRGWRIEGPVLESAGRWMVYGFGLDTDSAIAMAKERTLALLEHRLGLSTAEAYAFLAATAHLQLNEVVNPHHSARIEIPSHPVGSLLGEERAESEEVAAVPVAL